MTSEQLDALLREGAIERAPGDRTAAGRDLAAAEAHLVSLESRSTEDPTGAFTLGYDAMRKAIVAHMRAKGFRARTRGGAHYQTGRYALAALDGLGVTEHLRAFEDLRRLRNKSEYDAVLVDEPDALEAAVHARAVVEAVRRELGE